MGVVGEKVAHCAWIMTAGRRQPMALYRHEFAMCPWCDGESGSRVDHLYDQKLPTTFGPWYCDECGAPFSGIVLEPGNVEFRKEEKRDGFRRCMALLKFERKDGPTFFVMDHKRYLHRDDDTDEKIQDGLRFFFEEHSCPTNWLSECAAVIQDGDCDPHGFLEFVRAVDVPRDFDDQQWPILFPEAFTGDLGRAS
jgi:hypothetical protein